MLAVLFCRAQSASVCLWSVLDLNKVQSCFSFLQREFKVIIIIDNYNIDIDIVNVRMSTLILSIFLSWSTNHSRISFEKAVMGNSILLAFDCSHQRQSQNQEESFESVALRL